VSCLRLNKNRLSTVVNCIPKRRRGGRVAECGGLLISAKPLLDAASQRFSVWHGECVDWEF
jgi:hypothetical protein